MNTSLAWKTKPRSALKRNMNYGLEIKLLIHCWLLNISSERLRCQVGVEDHYEVLFFFIVMTLTDNTASTALVFLKPDVRKQLAVSAL